MNFDFYESIEKIKTSYKKDEYEKVIELCNEIYKHPLFNSVYVLYLHSKSLIRVGKPLDFVNVYRELSVDLKKDEKVMNNLCWCYYYGVIKQYDYKDLDGFEKFLNTANYIIKNTKPDYTENTNPYILTVLKVVRIYKQKTSRNYNEILSWLDNLDKDKLSDECYEYKDQKGKLRELASHRERYYQHKTEAYEKIEEYEKCIQCCNEAFSSGVKWHYRNGKWLNARKLYCECIVNNGNEKQLQEYKKMAFRENEWFMYSKLSDLYYRYNNPNVALIFAFKTLLTTNDYDKLVKVFMNIGILLKNFNNLNDAVVFFQASAYYRYKNAWNFPEELEFVLMQESIEYKKIPELRKIIDYAKSYLLKFAPNVVEYLGIVERIDTNKKSGIIKYDNNQKIYFSFRNLNSKKEKICQNNSVSFLIDTDEKNRKYAKNVRVIKNGSNNK